MRLAGHNDTITGVLLVSRGIPCLGPKPPQTLSLNLYPAEASTALGIEQMQTLGLTC